jgi:hypothetical protein
MNPTPQQMTNVFMVWAVVPPMLAERFNEETLKGIGHRFLLDKPFAASVLRTVNELEEIVLDGDNPSWGVWPLWLDQDGLEFCGAISLILGVRLKSWLSENDLDPGMSKTIINALLESKAAAGQ